MVAAEARNVGACAFPASVKKSLDAQADGKLSECPCRKGKLVRVTGMMAFAAVLATALAGPAHADRLLTGDEIRKSHTGHVFTFRRDPGDKVLTGTIQYGAGGRATAKVRGVGNETGTWSVNGNSLCTVFSGRKDSRICDRVEQVSARKFRSPRHGFTAIRLD